MAFLCNGISVSALNEDKNPNYDVETHTGYSFVYENLATYFRSYDDYVEHAYEASCNLGLGDIYPMNFYFENYDYIYVPTFLKDKTDAIECIFITPRYCRVTYKVDDMTIDTYHYFRSDNENSCEDCPEAFQKISADNNFYQDTKWYYCCCDNSYFKFDRNFDLNDMGEAPFVKVYIDKHLQEKDGDLYYTDDSGKTQSGWKTVNGHEYYFCKSDGKAAAGKIMVIDGYAYKFNDNGICKGKYTGYAVKADGARVYYKNGVVSS